MCVLRCVLCVLGVGTTAMAAPNALQEGSEVQQIASGGVLNATVNGGYFLGGLEVDPESGAIVLIAHNTPVWGFSNAVRFIEIPVGGVPELSGAPFTQVEQQTRGNDLTLIDGVYYFAGRRGVINGIYGFVPGQSTLETYAAGAGIPRWATSGLTFSSDGTMARVTSNALLGHYMVAEGATSATQVVTEQPLPTGLGGAASDHVITKDDRIIAIGESGRKLLDITNGAGNVAVLFDLNTLVDVNVNDGSFGSRAAVDPVSGDIFVSYAVGSTKIYRIKADGSGGILFADGFTGTTRDIDFGPATDGSGAWNLFVSAIDAPSTGAVYEFTVPQEAPPPLAMGCVPWYNGEPDYLTYVQSQDSGGIVDFRVADDCLFLAGDSFYLREVRLVMGLHLPDGLSPEVRLEIFDDCDGQPGELVQVIEEFAFTPLGLGPDGEMELYEFRFPLSTMQSSEVSVRRWISPVGEGAGAYFWISSNEGRVQGRQTKVISAGCDTPGVWLDGDRLRCFPFCSDMNFEITGDCCKPVLEETNYAHEGLPSQNLAPAGPRAGDDFQIPPGDKDRAICSIEVWMATNCDPSKSILRLYPNECEIIAGDPIAELIDPEVHELVDTVVYRNVALPVYRLVWRNPELVLIPGRNYWVVPIVDSSFAATDHALFLFTDDEPCQININEGLFRNPLKGFPEWTPTSHREIGAERRDFAMRIWLRTIDCTEGQGDDLPRLEKPPIVVPALNQVDERPLLKTFQSR